MNTFVKRSLLSVERLEDRLTPYVFGADDRVSSSIGPVVRVVSQFPDGNWTTGSGTSVGTNLHVLTAGHCLYREEYGGMAVQVLVYANVDDDGSAATPSVTRAMPAARWVVHPQWEAGSYNFDVGYVAVYRQYGGLGGTMAFEAPTDADLQSGVSLVAAGYPGDLSPDASRQVSAPGTVAGFTADLIGSYADIKQGQSGGPLYRPAYKPAGSPFWKSATVWGVLSHEYTSGSRPNQFKRLTPAIVTALKANFSAEFTWLKDIPPYDPMSNAPPIPDGYRGAVYQPQFSAPPPTTLVPAGLPPLTAEATTVTLAPAAGQANPVPGGPVRFDLTFSRPVTGLSSLDLQLSGPPVADGGFLSGVSNDSLDGKTWVVTLSGLTRPGVITVSLPAGAATDSNGDPTPAAGPASVGFGDFAPTTVTLAPAAGQANPVPGGPVRFDLTFSRPVTGLSSLDLQLSGPPVADGGFLSGVSNDSLDGKTWVVTLSGLTRPGVITVSLPAGAATDSNGDPTPATGPASVGFGSNTAPTVTAVPAVSLRVGDTRTVEVTLDDAETLPGDLQLTATVSGGAAAAAVSGTGATRTVTLTGAAAGAATVTLTVRDAAGASAVSAFAVTVAAAPPPNTAPTITLPVNSLSVVAGGTAGLTFTVDDAETDPADLTVTVATSDPVLLPLTAVAVGGGGSVRDLLAFTAAGTAGPVTLTVTVTDAGRRSASATLALTITRPNTPPELAPVGDLSLRPNTARTVVVAAWDGETPAAELTVTATSSAPAVVAAVLSGSGPERVLTLTAGTAAGTATVTLRAADPAGLTVTRTFAVTVLAAADLPPSLSPVVNLTLTVGEETGVLVTAADPDTPAELLQLAATSSDPAVRVAVGAPGTAGTARLSVFAEGQPAGPATVTLTARDAAGNTATVAFLVTVRPPDTAPTVSAVPPQTVTAGGTPVTVGFTLGDDRTPADQLQVFAYGGVPGMTAVLGGAGANRTLRLTAGPGPATTGVVELTVTDGRYFTSFTVPVTVVVANTPPTITTLPDLTLVAGRAASVVGYIQIEDEQTWGSDLVVTATSSNPAVLPASAVTLTGLGAYRAVNILPPPAGVSGPAAVTLTVRDPSGATTSTTFAVAVIPEPVDPPIDPPVDPVNTAPTLAPLADLSIPAGTGVTIPLQIDDGQTAADLLTVVAFADTPFVLPTSQLVLVGRGRTQQLSVAPVGGAGGTALVTVQVLDPGGLSVSRQFRVTVTAAPGANTPPALDPLPDLGLAVGATGSVALRLADGETAAEQLAVSVVSSDPAVVLAVAGGGAARTLTVTPAAAGTADVTVTVTDAGGLTATRRFRVTATAPVSPPPVAPPPVSPPPLPPATVTGYAVGGANGSVVTTRAGVTTARTAGGLTGTVRTATADFTGDGVADTVAGSGPGGPARVLLIDGATGATLLALTAFEASFTGGVFVAAGDLTGDGRPELVVTPDRGGGPVVAAFAADGTELARFYGIEDESFRGGARAAVGDVDGDGKPELLVAAGFGGGPRLAIFDGRAPITRVSGAVTPRRLVDDFYVFEQTLRNGVFIAAGDLTADGAAEVVVGGGPGGGPRVFALDGRRLAAGTQSTVVDLFAGDQSSRGGVRVAVRDAQLVTGSGDGEPAQVRVYKAATARAGAAADETLTPFGGAVLLDGVYVG